MHIYSYQLINSIIVFSFPSVLIIDNKFVLFLPFIVHLGCGAAINLATFKDHASECKLKLAKVCIVCQFNAITSTVVDQISNELKIGFAKQFGTCNRTNHID